MIDSSNLDWLARYLDVNAFRHTLITSNLANIDTPSYRTVDVNFAAELRRQMEGPQYALLQPAAVRVQGLIERPDGNNVNLERESLLLAETQLRYRAGVELVRAELRRLATAIHEGKA